LSADVRLFRTLEPEFEKLLSPNRVFGGTTQVLVSALCIVKMTVC